VLSIIGLPKKEIKKEDIAAKERYFEFMAKKIKKRGY